MHNFVIVVILLFAIIQPSLALELKVGVYDNPPLVFKEGEEIKGFFIDILGSIAEEEGWEIEYVYDNFPNLLEKLKNGEIDLLVDIAYTEERAKDFKFSNETVLTNWGVVVSKEHVDSILDLDGLIVAVVKGDVYYEGFKRLVDDFNIECGFVEVEGDYIGVFEAVKSGKADVGVVSRLFSYLHTGKYGLKESNIIFSPVELRFAGNDKTVLDAIDSRLRVMKEDANSVYYQALDRWFGPKAIAIPQWIYPITAALLIILVSVILSNVYLSREVAKRTKEVEERGRFLEAVFNTIQEGISVLDADMSIIMVNHAMKKWYGDVVGRKCYEAYHGRNELCENCPTIEAIKTGKMKSGVVPGPGGGVEWVELFSYPVIEGGRVKMVVEFVRDITVKRRMEEELKKALERYEYLWNSANDIFFIHDLEGRIISVNRKAMEIVGQDEMEDANIWDFIPTNYHDSVREKIDEIVRTKEPTPPFEIPLIGSSGKTVWIEVVAHPVIENGEVLAIHGVAREITERRELIEKIEENIKLISFLVDRIRNPLAAARAYCELRDKLGNEIYGKVIENIDRITVLVDDLDRVWGNLEKLRRGLRKS
ncbi:MULTISPECIES: PAS domain S-box protein [unclassified Archaeoglobus]|jgi:PAS domain S-box-containing protein|uniref:PAS domain S-box protein n=1 Tax=unclassified Archaeoglobus TaxID=2643606 RepID=UPI0025BEC696|nr:MULTISPECIES: PAS domain S-box protein [unclassified Archaeoglobus]